MITVAIDPGRNFCGWSVFEGTSLVDCGVSRLPKEAVIWPLGKICAHHAGQIPTRQTTRVVVEQMRMVKARAPTLTVALAVANDLLALTSIAAFIAGRMGGVLEYVPHHPCPKEVTKQRVLHKLSTAEHIVLDAALAKLGKKQDDLFDACLHGLNAVGR